MAISDWRSSSSWQEKEKWQMTPPEICPIANRRHEKIPIDRIQVVNSRLRDEEQLRINVQSINQTGLMLPIRVNDKFLPKSECPS